MPRYSTRSKRNLATCDEQLQRLFGQVIKHFDCIILEGYRNEEAQNRYYHEGRSTLKWPESHHNALPSRAVDAAPYPVDWNDRERFYFFGGIVMGIAADMKIPLRWGGDWDRDTEVHDQTFFDLPHFELIGE